MFWFSVNCYNPTVLVLMLCWFDFQWTFMPKNPPRCSRFNVLLFWFSGTCAAKESSMCYRARCRYYYWRVFCPNTCGKCGRKSVVVVVVWKGLAGTMLGCSRITTGPHTIFSTLGDFRRIRKIGDMPGRNGDISQIFGGVCVVPF